MDIGTPAFLTPNSPSKPELVKQIPKRVFTQFHHF